MKIQIKVILLPIILSAMIGFSNAQDMNTTKNDKINRGSLILKQAQEAIYHKVKKEKISSFFQRVGGTVITESFTKAEGFGEPQQIKSTQTVDETISFQSPDKVNHIVYFYQSIGNPTENYTKIADILNGDKVARQYDLIADGKSVDFAKDIDNPKFPENLKKEMRKNLEEKLNTSKETILKEVGSKVFPIFLEPTWINNKNFVYVGEADAGEIKADILELDVTTGRQTRYFFDKQTHLLLMITDEVSKDGKSAKITTYFSDYQLVEGMMIAKKVNIESETTDSKEMEMMGKTIKMSNKTKVVTETIIKEFKINPTFKPEIFTVKEKK